MGVETAIRALQHADEALGQGAWGEAVRHLDVAAIGLCGGGTAAVALVSALVELQEATADPSTMLRGRRLANVRVLVKRALKRAEEEARR